MKVFEILEIVEKETGITIDRINSGKTLDVLYARYLAIVLMYEEGYKKSFIAK